MNSSRQGHCFLYTIHGGGVGRCRFGWDERYKQIELTGHTNLQILFAYSVTCLIMGFSTETGGGGLTKGEKRVILFMFLISTIIGNNGVAWTILGKSGYERFNLRSNRTV